MNIFQQEAMIDILFKKLSNISRKYEKNIVEKRVMVKGTGVSGDVYVAKFFTLLGGTVDAYANFETVGSGVSHAGDMTLIIKNLETQEIQSFELSSGGNGFVPINLSPCTRYEIRVNVREATTIPTVYLTNFYLGFDVITSSKKYIVSEQAEG